MINRTYQTVQVCKVFLCFFFFFFFFFLWGRGVGGTKCVLWKLMHTGSIDF